MAYATINPYTGRPSRHFPMPRTRRRKLLWTRRMPHSTHGAKPRLPNVAAFCRTLPISCVATAMPMQAADAGNGQALRRGQGGSRALCKDLRVLCQARRGAIEARKASGSRPGRGRRFWCMNRSACWSPSSHGIFLLSDRPHPGATAFGRKHAHP